MMESSWGIAWSVIIHIIYFLPLILVGYEISEHILGAQDTGVCYAFVEFEDIQSVRNALKVLDSLYFKVEDINRKLFK